jgi:phenylalanyl-tRNA synthetase beta chain
MLAPYSWLKDFLNNHELIKNKLTATKIGERLSVTFNEFEGLKKINFTFPKIVIGRILKIDRHPHADKLSITVVDIGTKKLNIVCGAVNIAVGMYVPVAIVGAKLGAMEIKKVTIRDIESEGMICSAEELGLEEKSTGILDLGGGHKPGAKFTEIYDFDDEIMELSITPNRADASNIIGIAKEISATCDIKFVPPKSKIKENSRANIDKMLTVQIKDPTACRRYSARIIEDVKIGESPLWLKRRLIMCGLRPINTVVDITNYILLEYGQPMHAFDYDLIIGHKLIVRRAKKGERINTLDDQKKVLSSADLVIADEKRPLAIAGIMGGKESSVLPNTHTIVLESANFARDCINLSAKNLGIMTDSSIMFGKGLPMSKTEEALDRAAYLIQELCHGSVVRGMIDVRSQRILKKDIKVKYEAISDLLGIEITKNDIKKILTKLEFVIKETADDYFVVTVPDYRIDIEHPEDMIEEIGRIYGYEHIPDQTFSMPVTPARPENLRRYKNKIIRYFYDRGWSEVYSYSFNSASQITDFGFDLDSSYELENAVDKNNQYLRQSLLPGLLDKFPSWSKSSDRTAIYEWGRVFDANAKQTETDQLAILFNQKLPTKELFLQVKGVIEGMIHLGGKTLSDFHLCRANECADDIDYLHPFNSLIIRDDKNKPIGCFGLIHPALARRYKISLNVIIGEFNLENLISGFDEIFNFIEPSKFPTSLFDASFIVSRQVMSSELIASAQKTAGHILAKVEVFDEYTGDKLPAQQKSISLRFSFNSPHRTLDSQEVATAMEEIYKTLAHDYSAVLRDK